MSDNKKPEAPIDMYTQSCGWRIKHAPHLGFDISGDVVLSCPGAFEYPKPLDPTDVGDRYA